MPKLSDTMTEGVVAEWHKKVGDEVNSGDLLAEIETDKATMEFESFQEGVLLYHGVEKGEAGAVDSILAILGEKGEDYADVIKEFEASQAKEEEEPKKEEPKKAEVAASAEKEAPVAAAIKSITVKMMILLFPIDNHPLYIFLSIVCLFLKSLFQYLFDCSLHIII